jgi:hypothetical protein
MAVVCMLKQMRSELVSHRFQGLLRCLHVYLVDRAVDAHLARTISVSNPRLQMFVFRPLGFTLGMPEPVCVLTNRNRQGAN